MDDLGGGGPTRKEFDLLVRLVETMEQRIDALRANVNVLMGREPPGPETGNVRPFGIGITTWAALLTAFAALLGGIAAILGAGS